MYTCPNCGSEYGYDDGTCYNCPECGHIWTDLSIENAKVRDAVGNELKNGDDVITIRDLKLGNETIKRGTKAKGIRILDEEYDGHDIDGKVDKYGSIYLKSSVVKKL
ncbi:MAG: zinc ribbon domain-containing protein YjdM [Peptoniphilaceae bacterium]